MWFQIELPQATLVTEMQIDSAPQGGGFLILGARGAPGAQGAAGRGRGGFGLPPARGPVSYTLQLSMDGTTWGTPVAQGAGETLTTIIPFPPAQAKFIRITQTGTSSNGEIWGIQQLRLYGKGVN
jgi:hypothetical protein